MKDLTGRDIQLGDLVCMGCHKDMHIGIVIHLSRTRVYYWALDIPLHTLVSTIERDGKPYEHYSTNHGSNIMIISPKDLYGVPGINYARLVTLEFIKQ